MKFGVKSQYVLFGNYEGCLKLPEYIHHGDLNLIMNMAKDHQTKYNIFEIYHSSGTEKIVGEVRPNGHIDWVKHIH